MAAGRSTNTMQEGLYKSLAQIAQMATAPDADLQFLTKLQVDITQYLRNPQPAGGPGGSPPGGDPSQGGGAPPGPQPSPFGAPGNTGGAMPGLGGGAPMDEIARILGGAGGQ